MRPLCKLSSETGVQLVFFHICLIYGIEVNGSEARASTWCAELHYCAAMPLEYLVTMLDHKRVARIPRPRVPFYEDEFMEGKYLHRRYFLFPRVAKLVVGSRASREPRRSLLRGWNNACVHIPEYVNLYHYVFIVFFPFFFFLCRMKEGIGGTGLDTPCQLFRIFK